MNFDTAISRVLDHEGGYVNNPRDPGGETKFGISKRSYPHLNIAELTFSDAKAIYFADFWTPLKLAKMPQVLAYQMLDSAVNHGMGNTVRMLQRAIGAADDGHFGPVSFGILAKTPSDDVALLFLAERLDFMTNLNRFDTFGRGWSRRIAQNMRFATQDN